jgi:hypothetical protein
MNFIIGFGRALLYAAEEERLDGVIGEHRYRPAIREK